MILDNINSPQDLKKLPQDKLPELAKEIRRFITETVSETGGHLSASLGAVDIAICLHYCLNTPKDIIVWDVGHQAYAHKILTGRKSKFGTLRQKNGLSGFPNTSESEYDPFTVGHGSTSISTALGLVAARDIKGTGETIAVVIGDGSLGGGMALEALNHAGHFQKDILIILNDNEFSISHSVGAYSKYLNRVITNPIYNRIRKHMQDVVKKIPKVGSTAFNAARRLEEALKTILVPGIIFEEMGVRYFGPVDGHNTTALLGILKNVIPMKEPRIIHVVTKKGKGYKPAEQNPSAFHGTSPFNIETGLLKKQPVFTFTDAFSEKLTQLAEKNKNITAITAAMPEGTGLVSFKEKFPDRFFNVGMAEEHAVGFAAGLAKKGLTPVVCIYSTFLQRSYDQIQHDVCLQNLHVVFCIDRAGIAGEDGATHHGLFDIAYTKHIPNIVCMAPKDEEELKAMLEFAIDKIKGPVAIRYPRGPDGKLSPKEIKIEIGKSETLRAGKDVAILGLGGILRPCLEAGNLLQKDGISTEIVNTRFIKPLDKDRIKEIAKKVKHIVTVEDGTICGGFGSSVLELLQEENIIDVNVKLLGLPDKFIAHGKRNELLSDYGLDAKGIASSIKKFLKT
ncbi:MAG: 1-deoxy-D-xylulose-5-phosphate synthase [Candidatus Omnitrophica bacterium]|nr:1-deoxy-D-xylulose-5-phosphate synthase [Candidatus Omnitrophota bacterium]